jgi:uncharacterized membrane protein
MTKITFLAIVAIISGSAIATTAVFGFTIVIAQMADNATMGNMTGGNMTMGAGNMTDGNMTEAVGQISGGGGRCGGTCYADSD